MCGIAGKISAKPFPMDIVLEMGNRLKHRGPDDHGFFAEHQGGIIHSYGTDNQRPPRSLQVLAAIVHQRLAIVDLSPQGHQPMPNEDASLWLVCNGEIYNAPELRERLQGCGHIFSSRSDSEVILHGYEEWGEGVVLRLRGMFAFALWNTDNKTLFCARDPMGIKPLYYRHTGEGFSFASEIKAFLAEPDFSVEPEFKAINQYLQYSFPLDDITWFKGVRSLLPGHTLHLGRKGLQVRKYYEFSSHPTSNPSGHSPEALHATLKDAVNSHLMGDVDIGFHLSGGLDSSGLVALAASLLPRSFHTFSGRFQEGPQFDEKEYLDEVRRRFETTHHETIPTAHELKSLLPFIIWHLDEPVAGPGSFPQFYVSRLVSDRGVKVVCGGQGADELFGGYPWYLPEQSTDCHTKRQERISTLCDMFPGFKPDRSKDRFLEGALSQEEGLMTWDVRYYLPALLHVEDRTSMASSVESRVPYLDKEVVDIASSVPSHKKIENGVLKNLLRKALSEHLPEKVVNRRDKMGFPTPVGLWFKGPLRDWVEGILCSDRAARRGILETVKAREVLEEHLCLADRSIPLWQALNVELWFQIFVDGELP